MKPFILHHSGDDSQRCPAVGPREYCWLLGRVGGEIERVWSDANASQVEPVRIPAGLDRDIRMSSLVRMPGARAVQQLEVVV